MEADVQELSRDNFTIVYTFLREDVVKIEGAAKTGEVEETVGR